MAAPARAPASKAGAGSVTYWGPENILIGEIETFDQGYGGISNLRDQGPRLPTRRGRAVAAGAPLSARDGDIGAGGFPEPQLNNPLAPAQTLDPEIDNIANQSLCNNNHQGRNNLQLTREEHLQEAQRFDEELREIETKNREALRLMKYTTRLANEAKRRKYSRIASLVLTFLALIETILVVFTMIKPVPQFSLGGNLFYVQSIEADKYSKRHLIPFSLTEHEDSSIVGLYDRQNKEADKVGEVGRTVSLIGKLETRQDKSDSKPKPVPADSFVAFWFGAMGACLQRASGAIICKGGKINAILEQSQLPENVIATLPTSTGAAPSAFVLGCALNAIFIVYLSLVALWPRLMWTPHNLSQSWEKRFRFTVGSVSFLTIGALAAFIGATAQLRNDFSGAVDSIPALHADLLARFDKGFDSLYGACVVGAITVLGCLYLTWYSQEEDDRVSPKWAKAAVTRAPLDGRWNHARTIAEQSEVGSVAGGSEISAVRSTMAWQ